MLIEGYPDKGGSSGTPSKNLFNSVLNDCNAVIFVSLGGNMFHSLQAWTRKLSSNLVNNLPLTLGIGGRMALIESALFNLKFKEIEFG